MSDDVCRRVVDREAQDRWKDWTFLRGCLGEGKITPSDVDGIVERHGRFLLLEGKLPGGVVSVGQMLMYRALSKRLDAPLLILWGHPGAVREAEVWWAGELKFARAPCDTERVHSFVSRWYAWADGVTP